MALNKEKVMILVQRRLSILQGISRLTAELADALSRRDEVSVNMLLQMRADEMGKLDECMEEVWKTGEGSASDIEELRQLMTCDPFREADGPGYEERKIFEIRQKTQTLIKKLQEEDRKINRSVAGNQSFYD